MNRALARLAALSSILCLAAISALGQTSASIPQFGHVIVVVGENAGFGTTYNSGAMPYLDSLAKTYGLATNYYSDTHPSIGNYLVLTTGQILTNDDSQTPSTFPVSADNIALEAQSAGKTWKDYVENLPSVSGCSGLKSGTYYVRHDPLEYMTAVNANKANYVCFSQFATDVKNHALPNLSWLVPNGTDDGHDTSATDFDTWLQTEIGPLLASSYFQAGGDGLLIITFDEDDSGGSGCGTTAGTGCGGQVETVVISPDSIANYQSTVAYEHESTLRTVAEALALNASNLGAAASAEPMADFFSTATGSVTLAPSSLNFGNETVGTTSNAQAVTLTNGTSSSVSVSSIAIGGSNSSSFSEANSCPASLAAAASCTIHVTFTPVSAGNLNGTLTVTAGGSSQGVTLAGTGTAAAPSVSLSPALLNFSSVNIGATSAAQSVKVSNSGSGLLSITSIAAAAPFAETNNCGNSLAAGASCTIQVTFAPKSAGSASGSLLITDNATGSPQSASLSGTGAAVSGGSDFYVATTGNDSTGSGTLASPWATILHASTQIGSGATVHVEPGTYTVNPSSLITNASGTSTAPITYVSDTPYAAKLVSPAWDSDLGESVWVNTGNYVVIKGFDMSGDAYQGISNSGTHVVIQANHVHNIVPKDCNGNGGAGIDDYGDYSDDVGNIVNDVGNFSLGSCIYVHGIYVNRNGGHVWNNIVYHNWSFGIQVWGSSPQNVTLSGNTVFNNGVSGLVVGGDVSASGILVTDNIFVNNHAYGFEEEGVTATNTYLNNLTYGNGMADYNLQTGTVSGTVTGQNPSFVNYQADGGDVHLTSSSPAINAGTSQGAPPNDFDGNTRPQARSVANGWDIGAYEYVGAVSGGSVTLAPGSLSFGSETVGTSSNAQVVTLTNGTSSSVSVSSIAIGGSNSSSFSEANSCPASLAAAASCTIHVTFTPVAAGSLSGTLTVTAGGSSQSVTLAGTGTAAAPSVSLSPALLNFSSVNIGATSAAQSVKVSNSGSGLLSITSIAAAAPFAETNNCGNSLAAGASCTIQVTFAPKSAGPVSGSLLITDNATGSPQKVALSGTGGDFSIGPANGGSTSAVVSAGQTATYDLTVAPIDGFNGTVTLSCELPSGLSCSLSHSALTVNGNSPVAFSAAVAAAGTSIAPPNQLPNTPSPELLIALTIALFVLIPCRNLPANRRTAAFAASLLFLALGSSGCGVAGRPASPGSTNHSHTYTITITGQSQGSTRALNLTLTVN